MRLVRSRLILGLAVLLVAALNGRSQIAGGLNETTNSNMGGVHFIVGIVFGPSGRPVNVRMRLKLVSMQRGRVVATTDDTGRFVFSRVAVGSYSVVIDREKDFEDVNQTVDVEPNRTPQTYSISIRLTQKKASTVRPGVVDASSAAVPKRAFDLYKTALKRSAAKDHNGAIGLLRQAIEEYPDYGDALNELGVQYLLINEPEKADEELAKALKHRPNDYAPLVNRAIALFRQKKFADAEPLLTNAIKTNPRLALPHYYLGRCMTSLGRYDEAEKELRTAIELGGDEMKEAHRMLANLFLEKGHDEGAVKELEQYLELVPNAPDAAKLRKIIQQLTEAKPKGRS